MNLKDAAANLNQAHPEDTLHPLFTPWGEAMLKADKEQPILPEYPRPQMCRADYHMLNGIWEYAFVPADGSDLYENPKRFAPQGQIRVPFSPESLLSGVGRRLEPEEYLWYRRRITFPADEIARKEQHMHCILHFDAVDQEATVFLGTEQFGTIQLGTHHGGYLPFSLDITEYINENPVSLYVKVRDLTDTGYATRGKQTLTRGGMFYTAQSGIWQSVWYEWVPENYVINYTITPDYDKSTVTFILCSPAPFSHLDFQVYAPACDGSVTAPDTVPATGSMSVSETAPMSGAITASGVVPKATSYIVKNKTSVHLRLKSRSEQQDTFGLTHTKVVLSFPISVTYSASASTEVPEPVNFKPWTPEHPWLYPFTVTADEDSVDGYFAMRSFTVEKDAKGILRFCLNHKPYFLHGILDQGYWSDGLMTAPCDEALVYDITLAKGLGFNMLRKHIKIEPLRWYYHCDRLGMIVWQDMVSGGSTYHMPWVCYMPTLFPHMSAHTKDNHYELFSRSSEQGRKEWEQECLDTIDHLYNVPSIAVWVPFNEGWGQFDAARIAKMVAKKDPTRPVDHASGWFDQKGGDFRSIHNYFRPLQVKLDGKRAFVISEYGGYACHIDGHSSVDRVYGYQKYDTPEEMTAALKKLFSKQLFPLISQGLSGAVYTQLSDVEEEVNGLVTYDRRVVKLPVGHPFAAPSSFATPYSHGNKPESGKHRP